jgi:glycosyltransferase involved in cell wall biosynthesis
MTVALVTNYLPPYRRPLYRRLAEQLDVEVYCFGGEARYMSQSMTDLDDQLASADFPAHRLAHERDAMRLAKRHDAVISSTAGRVALPAAYIGARRSGRPFLLWASLWRHPRSPAHVISFPLLRHMYRHAGAVLTYGPHVSRYVVRYRRHDRGVIVAPQAVEPEVFGRAVSAHEVAAWRADLDLGGGSLVLFVGRLVREKGIDVLAQAWRGLGNGDARLCVIGDGPQRPEETVFGDNVVFAGRVRREVLPVAYAAADVLVVPSISTPRFREPWGLVCNEGMSQGCAVVATTAVGAAAGGLVLDRESGLVVEAGDAAALADAIGRLLADATLRAQLGRRAKALVSEHNYDRAAEAFGRGLAAAGVS